MATADDIRRQLDSLAKGHPLDPAGEVAALASELAGVVAWVEALAESAIAAR